MIANNDIALKILWDELGTKKAGTARTLPCRNAGGAWRCTLLV
jgi:hypothetical protein